MDFVTRLPLSKGTNAILVITNHLSKSVVFKPMPSITMDIVATMLIGLVFYHHRLPIVIVSNYRLQFVSII